MATSVPTTPIGYTQAPQYSQMQYEDETTPELQWPQSVVVFDAMRKTDSQCASVLRAVTLPVRRTPWRIDPAGARAEVVEFVADNLGLPIVGQHVKPPLRSKDKFSWAEHLRLALLMLPLGHSYFEQVYRVEPDGSRAHLRKLEFRPAKTISDIQVASDGGLVSITQYWTSTNSKPRAIPVNRLVAYIHEREGGNWLGSSVLRSAYKNWLLKDRLLRVQAQTIERNGMGIPLYKAQEGASGDDLAAGKAMATAWRAGEAAGSAVPFGADLVLRGVEGTLPDADPVVRYHDEQIARAVLAHFLNLGTQTGSWALGTTFADFFTLSLQTLAQQIADTASQHIIEDLVDVNFGEQEPAPRLVFDEIGSRQAATAQAMKLLVDAGLITPDQVLDETLRQQYGLPPADPETATPPPLQAPPSPAPEPEPVPGEGSVAASAGDLLDRALRIIAEFEKPGRRIRRPVKAGRKSGSVDQALGSLRTLRGRLSGALLKELDQIIASLEGLKAGAAPVAAHGTHNQKDHGRRRAGTLGSVLDKLSSLRDKLNDDDRAELDKAMDQLRGLESSDVDDDDLIEDEPEADEEDEDGSDYPTMDSDVGELEFVAYLDGDVDINWEEGDRSLRFNPAAQREIADAVAKFNKLPVEPPPKTPDFPPPANIAEMTERDYQKWYGQQLEAWYASPEYLHHVRTIAEMVTADGEYKVIRQAGGNTAIGDPAVVDDPDGDGWDDVIQLGEGEQADEFVEMLRQAQVAAGNVQAKGPRRSRVAAHGNHDQSTHGRKKGLSLPKVDVPKAPAKKAAPRKAAPAPSTSEVDQARLKLDHAVQMHGADRSKWTKKDRDAAARLDKLIADGDGKAAPKAPAKSQTKPARREPNLVPAADSEPWKAPNAGSQLASAFHDQWRETRRQSDGSYEPRVKTTKDKAWAAEHGTDQVDIANTDFDDLPDDWKAENKAAAETVIELLELTQGTRLDTADKRNEAGDWIHNAWLERNPWARDGELGVPFAQLSKEEQDKDIAQYETALKLFPQTRSTDRGRFSGKTSAAGPTAEVVAHQPGRHNQADHGRKKGMTDALKADVPKPARKKAEPKPKPVAETKVAAPKAPARKRAEPKASPEAEPAPKRAESTPNKPAAAEKTPRVLAAEEHVKKLTAGLPAPLRKPVTDALLVQAQIAPGSMMKLRGLGTADLGGSGAEYKYPAGTIDVNSRWKTNKRGLDASFRASRADGYLTPSGSPTQLGGAVAHEFGHRIAFRAIDPTAQGMRRSVADKLLGPFAAAIGVSPPAASRGDTVPYPVIKAWMATHRKKIASQVSEYGSESVHEMLGEAWQEFSTMGDKARPAAKAVGGALLAMFEGGGS